MYPLNSAITADLNTINRLSAWIKASGFVATFVPAPIAAKQETRLLRQLPGDASFWDGLVDTEDLREARRLQRAGFAKLAQGHLPTICLYRASARVVCSRDIFAWSSLKFLVTFRL
jgi:hypothetical protein